MRQETHRLSRSDVGNFEHPLGIPGDEMNEQFLRDVENYCRWIADESRNFRHSDVCRLAYCIGWATDLLRLLEDKEEELENIN